MGRVRTRVERLEKLQNSGSVSNVTGTPPIVVTTPSVGTRNVAFSGAGYQPSGNYITALTGDGSATGPGSVPFTLAAGQRRYTGTAAGTNTYTTTATPLSSGYAAGDLYSVTFTNGNTTASTFNDQSLGAKAIQYKGAALVGGEIPAGSTISLVYDGTQFQIIGVIGASRYFGTASGTNTYTITASPVPVVYVSGDLYIVTFTNANTGSATLNANSLGAKAIQFKNAALTGGEIAANATMALQYDGTQFQLVGAGGGGGSVPTLAQLAGIGILTSWR